MIEDDVKSAVVIAAAVYALAMRDELLPQFVAGQMPPLPPTPTPSLTAPPRP